MNTYISRTAGTGSSVMIGGSTDVHHPSALEPSVTTTGAPTSSGSIEIDELAMWDTALSSSQVSQLYNMVPY